MVMVVVVRGAQGGPGWQPIVWPVTLQLLHLTATSSRVEEGEGA